MATAINDNLFTQDVIQDPYSYFDHVRETDPVHWNEAYELWLVTPMMIWFG
jgi:hypothetical protein